MRQIAREREEEKRREVVEEFSEEFQLEEKEKYKAKTIKNHRQRPVKSEIS